MTLHGPAKASALYDVTTYSQSGAFSNLSAECSTEATYDSNSGATGSPTFPANCAGDTFTGGGTPNFLGLTSSQDYTSAANTSNGSGGQSSVSADLATGSIHSYLTQLPGTTGATNGYANAQMSDQLTFAIPGATSSTTTLINFSYTLDGNFSISSDSQSDQVVTELIFGGYGIGAEWNGYLSPTVTYATEGATQDISCLTTSCFSVQGQLAVTGANPIVPFELVLNLECGGQDNCTEDYSNTGIFSLSLPQGVTYTSASGVFLTESSTPEPASFGLFACGLVAILLVRARLGRACR